VHQVDVLGEVASLFKGGRAAWAGVSVIFGVDEFVVSSEAVREGEGCLADIAGVGAFAFVFALNLYKREMVSIYIYKYNKYICIYILTCLLRFPRRE